MRWSEPNPSVHWQQQIVPKKGAIEALELKLFQTSYSGQESSPMHLNLKEEEEGLHQRQ